MSIFKRFRKTYIGDEFLGIKHYNWGSGDWFARFARHHFSKEQCRSLKMISVFGSRMAMKLPTSKHKIFFTGENHARYPRFSDNALPYVELSMGFDDIEAKNYLRFPLWILYLFEPESGYEEIKAAIDKINNFHPAKTDTCSLICSHDENNLRRQIFEVINPQVPVCCGGRYLHNDDRLWNEFNNDKFSYLQNFKISICPENSNRAGYVTEKLFEAFRAGTVPVYWGSDNNPEPNLVNPEAILFWDFNSDNQKIIDKIKELADSDAAYREFVSKPRLLPNCADYVWDRFQELEEHLTEIFNK